MEDIKPFLKSLNVLLIEDETEAREVLDKYLQRLFNEVESASDGVEALEKYQARFTNSDFDLIISDVDMPRMNGLEFVAKIREENHEIPIIFITGRSEIDNLIKAIELNVNSYIMKPLDLEMIYEKISHICHELYYKKRASHLQKESENYLNIINQVALVSKTDLDGNITFTNDAFCEISGFSRDELMGKNHNIMKHPSAKKELFETMWTTIQKGNIWEGKIPNLSKRGETFISKTKIIPIYDDLKQNIIEYMAIRFSITEEEQHKASFNKKVVEHVSKYQEKVSNLASKNFNLDNNLELLKKEIEEITSENVTLHEKNLQKSKKIKHLLTLVHSFENTTNEIEKIKTLDNKNKEAYLEKLYDSYKKGQTQNQSLLIKLEEQQEQFKNQNKEIEELTKEKNNYEKRIEDLKDLVSHYEESLKISHKY